MASYARRFVSLRRAAGRRLLRHDTGAHPPDSAGGEGDGAGRGAARRAVGRRQDAARQPAARAGTGAAGGEVAAWRTRSRPASSSPASRCRRTRARCDRSRRGGLCAARSRGVDVVRCRTARGAARGSSALSLAVADVSSRPASRPLLQYSCRDRNLLGIQSDLLGAHALGLRNMLGITGDVRSLGDNPDATAVFDVDSIGLTNVVSRLNHGLDIGGQPIGAPTPVPCRGDGQPVARDLDQELRRLEYKVEAGAEFAMTRPVFDAPAFERFLQRVDGHCRDPDHRGTCGRSTAPERRIHGQRGAWRRVPEALVERMRAGGERRGRARRRRARSPGNSSQSARRWRRACTSCSPSPDESRIGRLTVLRP